MTSYGQMLLGFRGMCDIIRREDPETTRKARLIGVLMRCLKSLPPKISVCPFWRQTNPKAFRSKAPRMETC